MNHNQSTPIEPINASSSKFAVMFENHFVVLDDGKHVIGGDGSDLRNLIIENIETGKADKFGWSKSSINLITTLVYDEDTGFLYTGDFHGGFYKYHVDITNKSCEKVKDYGKLGIGEIISSHRFRDFIFFGGINSKIKVLNLSTGKLLLGHLQTSIKCIHSLQVCVKSQDDIYLAVSGTNTNYSGDKTDLFDLTDLLPKDPIIHQKYL